MIKYILLNLLVLILFVTSRSQPLSFPGISSKLKETSARFKKGFSQLIPNTLLADKIRKRTAKKEKVTFSEFSFLSSATEDFWKIIRLVFTLGISQDFFIYGYLIGPLLSSSPKAWEAWPSTFELTSEKCKKKQSILRKREYGLFQIINSLDSLNNPENNEEIYNSSIKNINMIRDSLKSKDPRSFLESLKKLYIIDRSYMKDASKPFLKGCSGSILKSILASIGGGDGLPNLPLINRLNVNEISTILDKVHNFFPYIFLFNFFS